MSQSVLEAEDAVRELCDLMDRDAPAAEMAERAMEIGISYFGVENGHLTSIVAETDHWEIVASTDPDDGAFPVGRVVELRTTFCRHAFEHDELLALHDVPNQGWVDDVAFETHDLGCYLGIPISVDGEPYGTLCFVAADARATAFTDAETRFLELLARTLESELERQQREFEFVGRQNLIDVFSRILRHNLRNNMTVVRGHVGELLEETAPPPNGRENAPRSPSDGHENAPRSPSDGHENAPRPLADRETVMGPIDELLALSEKARELEAVVQNEFGMSEFSVKLLVQDLVEEMTEQYPNATFSVDAPSDVTVVAMPTIETALRELLENAAEHAGPEPTCTVAVASDDEAVEIRVADDGPGLSEQDRRVFDLGDETQLVHGSGVGLWMVDWIVRSHDGTVDATANDDGTTLTLSIPRPLVRGE